MNFSPSVLALVVVLTLTLFLSFLTLSYWRVQREDRNPLWLTVWLIASAIFAVCRLLQYAPLSATMYTTVPRVLLTASYSMAWLGYELVITDTGHKPARWERTIYLMLVAIPILLLWTGNLILTDEIVVRETVIGGSFHGVEAGILYMPAGLLILGLTIVPLTHLLRTPSRHKRENALLALGFVFMILFSLNDFASTALNVTWFRLSDYSYLPIAILFCYIQVRRFGLLYKDMNILVDERTEELSHMNIQLRAEILEREQAAASLQESEEKYRTVVENASDGITIIQNGIVKYANQRLVELRGETVADILGQHFEKYIHPDERINVVDLYRRRLAGEVVPSTYESVVLSKDETPIPVEITAGPISYHGTSAEIVILRDISERKKSEQALQRQLREMSAINTVAIAGAQATSIDELIERVTEALGRILYPDNFGVLLAGEERDSWAPHPSYLGTGPGQAFTPFFDDAAGKAIASGKIVRIDGNHHEPSSVHAASGNQSKIAVPILVNGNLFGCLNAESRAPGAFSEQDERILSTIAESMSTSIEKILLIQTEKRRRKEAEVLYNTTRDLVIERNLTKLLEVIVERAAALLGASGGGLYLCDAEKRQARCVVSYNTLRDYCGTVLRYGEGAAGLIAETGEPLLIEDYRTWEGRATVYEEDHPFISMIGVPLKWQDRVIGVLHILENRVRKFTQENIKIVTLFANQAAIAIENSRLIEVERRRRQESVALAEVGRDISSSLQLDIVLERIASHAKELLRVETSAVYLSDPDKPKLWAIAALGPDADEILQDPLSIGEGILGNIYLQKVGEIVNNTESDARAITIKGTVDVPAEHLMGVPILSKGELTGLIAVWRTGEGQEFQISELDFLTSLAQQAAIAIENARLFEDTRRRLAELEIIQIIASELRAAQVLDDVFPIILDQLIDLLGYGGALVDLVDDDSGEIVTVLAHGVWAPITGVRTAANTGGSGRVIITREPYVTADVVADGVIALPQLNGGMNATACVPIVAQQKPIGTIWVGRQSRTCITDEEVKLLAAIGEMVGNTIQRMKLHEQTVHQTEEIALAYDLTLEGWAKALELRDKETEGHSRRVSALTLRLARKLGIPSSDLVHIHRGVLLHDIGKMCVPDKILLKQGPLTEGEWSEMHKHPQIAYNLIHPILYLRPALDIPYCHHEKWDGSGYPRGLKGEQIPLTARLFAVVDVYDALSSDRPYRPAWPREKVLAYLREQSGVHFDPQVVEAFLRLLEDEQLTKRGNHKYALIANQM